MIPTPRLRFLAALGAGFALAIACSSSDEKTTTAPFSDTPGGSSGSGQVGGSGGKAPGGAGQGGSQAGGNQAGGGAGEQPGGSGGQSGGGAGGSGGSGAGGSVAGSGGGPVDGGPPFMDDAMVVTPADVVLPPPVCLEKNMYVSSKPIDELVTAGDDILGAVSHDERTIVWQSVAADGTVSVFIASRKQATDPFGAPVAVPASPLGFARGRVTLSPDGLRLIFVGTGGKPMAQLTRASTSDAFGATTNAEPFTQINDIGGEMGAVVGSPVVAPDDLTLFFVVGDPAQGQAFYRATRKSPSEQWGNIVKAPGTAFASLSGLQPTGISTDGRTVFAWDPSGGHTFSLYVADDLVSFNTSYDLGELAYASPAADCGRLYHSAKNVDKLFDLGIAFNK